MSTLVLVLASFGQCFGGQCPKVPPKYQQPQPQQQFSYFYGYPYPPTQIQRSSPQPKVIPVYRLQPGDLLVPIRTGLFGWRREYVIYRTQ